MVKDFKYIIKRIIIGVGIALVLMFLKGTLLISAHAKELSSTQWGYQYTGIDTNTAAATFNISGNPWANWRLGKLYFTIAVTKTSGSSTDPVLGVRSIRAVSDSTVYTCTFGANTSSNSTWTESTYSVICPMDLGWPGVTMVQILFNPIGQQTLSQYVVTLDGVATFEQDDSVNVNVDTSGTTTAINNQITNDNSNTQSIINNQNTNTDKEIESQKVCNFYDSSSIIESGAILSSSGVVSTGANSIFGVSDYISVINSDLYLVSNASQNLYFCFYNTNKSFISCINSSSLSNDTKVTIPSNASYVRFNINSTHNRPTFKICTNGNQAISNGQQQINDSITSTDGVSDSDINELFGELEESNTPISDLLTMPITLLNAYISGMSGTCQSISLGRLYGTNLIIPCINLESRLGSDLWNIIDILFSIFLIYHLSQLFITAFDGITSLRDDFEWAYGLEGRHIARGTRMDRYGD